MSDNTIKTIHGKYGKMNLNDLIIILKEKGYIAEYKTPVRIGYSGINPHQFFFQFLIEFHDGDCWIVHSTTSIRSDRINIQQWNAYHIRKIKDSITKSIIVYPDDISDRERRIAVSYYQKILNKQIYSAINDVVSQTEFFQMVETKYLNGKISGQQKAIQGLNFEEQIVLILNNNNNFEKWKNTIHFDTGLFFPYYKKIMDSINISHPHKIKELIATRQIPLLPSGGKPKTDVLLKAISNDGKVENFTFSLKRTSSEWVTVHEYSVDKFIEVLGITNQKLANTLKLFQKVGGKRALGEELEEYLEKELPRYNKELSLWVYGGVGGDGDPATQWANYIITFVNETAELKIYKLEDYIQRILTVEGHFGTPFRWTYPSGGKGERIQLKGKII